MIAGVVLHESPSNVAGANLHVKQLTRAVHDVLALGILQTIVSVQFSRFATLLFTLQQESFAARTLPWITAHRVRPGITHVVFVAWITLEICHRSLYYNYCSKIMVKIVIQIIVKIILKSIGKINLDEFISWFWILYYIALCIFVTVQELYI